MKTGTMTLTAALFISLAGAALGQTSVTTVGEGTTNTTNTTNTTTITTGTNTTGTTTTGTVTTGTGNTGTTENLSHPTKAHGELISAMIGRWTTTTKFWATPGTEPTVTNGASTMTATLGGRFVKQEFATRMGSNEFKGTSYFGFNTANQQLESFWVDNLSTGMLMSTGQRQSDGSIVWTATYTDEHGQTQTAKSVTRFPAKDTIVFESYEVASTGGEFKTMEVTYTRSGQVTPGGNDRVTTNFGTGTKTAPGTNTTNTTGTTTTTTSTTDASQTQTTTPETTVVPQ